VDHEHGEHESPPRFWGSRYSIGYLVIGAAATYFLLTEHLAHVVTALPFLLLAACPLMHIFMHHGHGGHGHQPGKSEPRTSSEEPVSTTGGGAS
jgi:hypothetical protein